MSAQEHHADGAPLLGIEHVDGLLKNVCLNLERFGGCTAAECARVLRDYGAETVYVITAAGVK